MKNQHTMPIFLIFVLSFSSISLIHNFKLGSASLSKTNEENMVHSVSYSIAKTYNDASYEMNSSKYRRPEYVKELPKTRQLRGETAVVEEIKTNNEYYDGSSRLNKLTLKKTELICGEWTTKPEACKKSGSCGWCASSSSCIPRDSDGPLLPCQIGAFKFHVPPKDWNPFSDDEEVKIIKQKIGPDDSDHIVLISSSGKKKVDDEAIKKAAEEAAAKKKAEEEAAAKKKEEEEAAAKKKEEEEAAAKKKKEEEEAAAKKAADDAAAAAAAAASGAGSSRKTEKSSKMK